MSSEYYAPYLQWIDHQKNDMIALVERLCNINSYSKNLGGLALLSNEIKSHLLQFGAELQELNLPPYLKVNEQGKKVSDTLGKALFLTKRSDAPIKVLLCGHMDTVYSPESSFQKVLRHDASTFIGPGVADMKAGLVIMLTALRALEKSPYANAIGWELLITPDEEIGSPGSRGIISRAAMRNHLGLIFEPSFSDGALVSKRGGSSYLTIVARGRAAHSGRDFHEGSSALFTILPVIRELEQMNSKELIVNVGELNSGTASNVVPDLAIARINLRSMSMSVMQEAIEKIADLVKKDARLELFHGPSRLPKELDPMTEKLLGYFQETGRELGIKIEQRETRGVSDGNILSEFGLPCIDTLGAVGGKLHSSDEYLDLNSLTERAKLTALFLMKLGNNEYAIAHPNPTKRELP